MLALQGLCVEELRGGVVSTEKLLGDLAGNAFAAPVIMAALLACLSAFQFSSESEDEEVDAIKTAFKAVYRCRNAPEDPDPK
eukprot:Skav229796  [mRNA]  locus=scaffold567:63787:64032:+ [translate_table: standard]